MSTQDPPHVRQVMQRFGPYIRFFLSALLLGRAILHIDWNRVQDGLTNLSWNWLLLGIVFLWTSNSITGIRWGLLMRASGFTQGIYQYIRLYFSGGLINQGLPTTIGGDTYRAVTAHQYEDPSLDLKLSTSILNVALDRSIGFAGNVILGAIGLTLGGLMLSPWGTLIGKVCILMIVLGIGILGLLLWLPKTRNLYETLMARLKVKNPYPSTKQTWGFPYVLLQIPVTVFVHLLTLSAFWACLKACHIDAPIESLLIGMPALGLLMILPISVSGWGIRETSLATILSLWNLDTSLVILASIFYGLITLITYIPGIYLLIIKRQTNLS